MIHVIATIEAVAGKRDALLVEFNTVVPLVRAEDGCIEYAAAIDTPTPLGAQLPLRADVIVVVEKWASLDALVAHTKAPHMAEYRERVMGLVAKVTLQVLQPA